MSYIIYRFNTDNSVIYEHRVSLESVRAEDNGDATPPSWAALGFHQCSNCTLRDDAYPFCPVAARLPPLIEIADRLQSYDEIFMEVELSERRIIQKTTAQRALSSLLGLVMATSACPHTTFFRPMARFHLPLASQEETEYRAVSMYLFAQYFLFREGHAVDLTLDGLKNIYRQLQRVNTALADRIRAACRQDTAMNAIILLDIFAKGVPYSIEDSMKEFRQLFAAFLPAAEDGGNEMQE